MTQKHLIQKALILTLITIFYNLVEGVVSVLFGMHDDALTLFGFGVDSFIEVISALGILHMIFRMKKLDAHDVERRDQFEKQALRITGVAFFILVVGLIAGSVLKIIQQSVPETTLVGIIVSVISIGTMYFLMHAKLKVGSLLHSDAIIADANCTKTCFYLSFVLLISSGLFEITGWIWFDVAGSLGIAWFAFSEGREAFEKASSDSLSCGCDDDVCEA